MDDYIEISAKTEEDAVTEALIRLETTSDMIEYEVIDKGSSGFLGIIGSKPVVIRVRKKEEAPVDVIQVAREFTDRLFKAMGEEVETSISINEEEGAMDIELSGPDMGVLIGKRGQTLDSIQYLISLVVNKKSDSYLRVRVDTENYRERRKATLENLARNIAFKVKRTRHSVVLEPMNPYERRIIHSALQNDKYVETHSEGEDPYRKIVVTLKKEYRDRPSRGGYGGYSRGSSYGRGGRRNRGGRGGYGRRYDHDRRYEDYGEDNRSGESGNVSSEIVSEDNGSSFHSEYERSSYQNKQPSPVSENNSEMQDPSLAQGVKLNDISTDSTDINSSTTESDDTHSDEE